MSSGHRTSAIPRPKSAALRVTGNDHTRLSDFTRPIPEAKQLVRTKGNRWMLALLALVVIAALLGALFVLPVQAWLGQEDDLQTKRSQLAVLEDANDQLAAEVGWLETPAGAKEAARDELGVVAAGEIRISMLDIPSAPSRLPAGWPYDAVNQIVATRAEQSAAPTPASTAPSVPATSTTSASSTTTAP